MSNPIALITGVGEGTGAALARRLRRAATVSRCLRATASDSRRWPQSSGAEWPSTQAAFAIALPCGVSSLCICSAVADGRLGIAIRCRFPSPFTSIETSITPRRR